jgi:thymidylate kinase
MIICLEGPNGVGKSTQAERLFEYFRARHEAVELMSDPGGRTSDHLAIREMAKRGQLSSKMARLFLYASLRADLSHYLRNRPPGLITILDRYAMSFYVYALDGFIEALEPLGCGNTDSAIKHMTSVLSLSQCVSPDLTIVFECDTEKLHERVLQQGSKEQMDAFERGNTLERLAKYSNRYANIMIHPEQFSYIGNDVEVINADRSAQAVTELMYAGVDSWWSKNKKSVEVDDVEHSD